MYPSAQSPDRESGAGVRADRSTATGRQLLNLEVRWRGSLVKKLTAEADPRDAGELRQLLVDAIRRDGRDESQVAEYEMDIRPLGEPDVLTTFVASARGN